MVVAPVRGPPLGDAEDIPVEVSGLVAGTASLHVESGEGQTGRGSDIRHGHSGTHLCLVMRRSYTNSVISNKRINHDLIMFHEKMICQFLIIAGNSTPLTRSSRNIALLLLAIGWFIGSCTWRVPRPSRLSRKVDPIHES